MANQKLPGLGITIRDGGLVTASPEPTTERLLIIGNALDGPRNTPIRIRSLSDAEAIFGPLVYKNDYLDPRTSTATSKYADNNLLLALHEAVLGGAGNIYLCRVGGTVATASTTFGSNLTISPRYAGRIYNSCSVAIASGATYTITVTQPTIKGGSFTTTVSGAAVSIGELCGLLNGDARNKTLLFSVPSESVANSLVSTIPPATCTFSGGTNGTSAPSEDYASSKANYYTALTAATSGTFDSLLDQEFNICLLAGIYGDDQVDAGNTTTVATKFAEFLYKIGSEVYPCHGVLGLRPTGLRTPTELAAYANTSLLSTSAGYKDQTARWINFGYFMNLGFSYADPDSGETVDVGRCLSIVAGPDIVVSHREVGRYYTNGAAVYAGMITNLPSQRATTNKPIGSVKSLLGAFPKAIHEQLNQGVGRDEVTNTPGGGAYVTFKTNPLLGVPLVVLDNTAASRNSDYKALQIFRIVNLAVQTCKAVLYPYIGEPNEIEARTSMRTQLTTALNTLVEAGCLVGGEGNGFKFTISSDIVDSTYSQINVSLFLRPSLQIKYIKVDVSVSH